MKNFTLEYCLTCEVILPFLILDAAGSSSEHLHLGIIAGLVTAFCNVSFRQHIECIGPGVRRYIYASIYLFGTIITLLILCSVLWREKLAQNGLLSIWTSKACVWAIVTVVFGRIISWIIDGVLAKIIFKGLVERERH